MGISMHVQIMFCSKPFHADIAFPRFFILSVSSLVISQVRKIRKSFVTMSAFVRFLPSMDSLVFPEVIGTFEGLVTESTNMLVSSIAGTGCSRSAFGAV